MTTDMTQRSTDGSSSSSSAPARLQEAAGGIADSAGQAAQSQASVAMNRAGEALEQVAQAIRDTSNQLRQERPEIAGVAETGAQQIDQLSMYLRQHDAHALIDDAERFARRQPAIVIGGGLALGLIVGRLLRSGAEPMTKGGQSWQSGTNGSGRSATAWTGGSAGSSSTAGTGYGTSYGTDYGTGYASTAGTSGSSMSGAGQTGSIASANSTARGSGVSETDLGATNPADELAYTDASAGDTAGSSTSSGRGSRRKTSTSGS
jgi:ElaB/YqjD/DUF883 family membrane-anchored ribosome-binding protein